MLSLRQLAKLAGVSPATAYRALNGLANVAPATRERVLQMAAAYHYAPLVRGPVELPAHQRMIGWVSRGFYSTTEISLGTILVDACAQHHCRWLCQLNKGLPVRTVAILQEFEALGVDGIIMHSGHFHPLPAELIQHLLACGIPVVTYDVTPVDCPVDWVGTDETALGEMAVDYLYRLGHRRIAYLGFLSKGPVAGRPRAIFEALVRRGLPTDMLIDRDFKDADHELAVVLGAKHPPTAIIGDNDELAARAMTVARHMGLNVPAQLSVLGVGNYPLSAHLSPPLTTIAQPTEAVAKRAVELLFARMDDPSPLLHGDFAQVALPAQLIKRASCVPPRQ